jgi:hypothetical protein
MTAVQNVIDRARTPLNDNDKERYSDPQLLGFLNDGVAIAYSVRPDLRFGSYGKPVELLELDDTFPLGAQHEAAIQHYIVFRAETRDDEHVNANREQKELERFKNLITST